MKKYAYGYVYIMTNRKNGTLYIGVTSDLYRRIKEHKTGSSASFAKKYALFTLVYIEQYKLVTEAITREKQLKA
jgi:putative endonuclease